jgi:hypothetical protein
MRRLVPEFARRPLTWDDFTGVCRAEGIDVGFHEGEPDERLMRGDLRSRISLRRRLRPTYQLFVAWHALGHYVLHPSPSTYHFERGRMDSIETEASLVGLLALTPWVAGPPYPRLHDVVADETMLVFHVRYPDRRGDGRIDWRAMRMTLSRSPGDRSGDGEGCHDVAQATMCHPGAAIDPAMGATRPTTV